MPPKFYICAQDYDFVAGNRYTAGKGGGEPVLSTCVPTPTNIKMSGPRSNFNNSTQLQSI